MAEHFVKLGRYDTFFVTHRYEYEDQAPWYHTYDHSPAWMRFLVNRCGIVAEEHFYYLSYKKIGRLGFDQWNMNKGEVQELCGIVTGLLSEYTRNRRMHTHWDSSITLLLKRHQARLESFQRLRDPVHLSTQICYEELPTPLPIESDISARIAYLQMSADELDQFCLLLSSGKAGDVSMMQMGLDIMERQSDNRLANFRLHTGYTMPEFVEASFDSFIEEASKILDLGSVLDLWDQIHPFTIVTPIVCGVHANHSRLSPDRHRWIKIKEMSKEYTKWNWLQQLEFCQIVTMVTIEMQEYKDKFDKSLALFEINLAMPWVNHLCGFGITRLFPAGTHIAVVDGLVAEAGKVKACPFITLWNEYKVETVGDLDGLLMSAPVPPAHDAVAQPKRRGGILGLLRK